MNSLDDIEDSFKSMIEVLPNALILVDVNGVVVYINKLAEELFQYSKEELIGKKVECIVPQSHRSDHHIKRKQFIHKKEYRAMGKGRDLFALRKDDSEFPAEVGLSPIVIQDERYVLTTVIDITERKEIEHKIIKQKIKLEELTEELHNINRVLEKKNQDINESIEYARNIQYSILPDITMIRNYLTDFFVYFEPKNIIGGDFFWFYQVEDISYIAAVDCTGHSVPGAMISMVVHSLLNEIMIKNPIQTTGNILSNLHRNLYNFFQQHKGEEYSQDGCDIALCKVDKKNKLLQFSGARQDIYICREDSIETIKSTSKSIGGLSVTGLNEPERHYNTTNIDLLPDMTIAMVTDGILDQLNSEESIFGTRHLCNLIQKNYSLPLNQAQDNTFNVINSWKENTQQQDDMLMLSFQCK